MRRLVRQFDLDITGIHGTGPAGRIRVGDVMGLLGGRTDSGKRDVPARLLPEDDVTPLDDPEAEAEAAAEVLEADVAVTPATPLPLPTTTETAPHSTVPTSSVFECDLGRVLAHRKKLRSDHVELLTTQLIL